MLCQGTNSALRWDVDADEATGVRVNSATGKVYLGNFGTGSEPAGIIELDPADTGIKESASTQVARLRAGPDTTLGTLDDVIDEYTKAGMLNPQAVASSGALTTLQT